MKTVITCDEVFETLTSGPYHTGQPSATQIDRHLEDCSGCSELAEALRPACNLLHEALSSAERAALPMFIGDEDRHVRELMDRITGSPASTERPHWSRRATIGNVLAASLLFLLLLPWFFDFPGQYWSSPPQVFAASHALDRLKLPAQCVLLQDDTGRFHPSVAGAASCGECHAVHVVSSSTELRHTCCTSCHRQSPDTHRVRSDMPVLIAACQICH